MREAFFHVESSTESLRNCRSQRTRLEEYSLEKVMEHQVKQQP